MGCGEALMHWLIIPAILAALYVADRIDVKLRPVRPLPVVQEQARQELVQHEEPVGLLLVLQGQAPAPPGCEERKEMTDKKDVKKWLEQVAKNDKDHGRDSKDNPNNKKNGK